MKKAFKALVLALALAIGIAGIPVPEIQAAVPTVPSGHELVDLITNADFENPSAPLGFEPNGSGDGTVTRTTTNPIAGTASLKLDPLNAYGRIIYWHDYGYGSGPYADFVTFAAQVRVDAASASGSQLRVCSIAYLQTTNVPLSTCQDYPVNPSSVVDVFLSVDTAGQQLDYVFPQFTLNNSGTITATVDDAHFYVVQPQNGGPPACTEDTWTCTEWSACSASGTQTRTCTLANDCPDVTTPSPATSQSCTPPPADSPPGTYPSSSGGRYVAMISPTNGETFWAPSTSLRLIAQGFDPNVYTNHPTAGHGQNASEVKFFVGNDLVLTVSGGNAEYSVFKGFVDVALAPGQHHIRARAIYANPTEVLDSPPFTITVENPPTYAQTVNLTQDVVLSAGNPTYELVGAPTGRIRLNGNGYKIAGTGNLTLKYVDVYGLGSTTNGGVPGIDVTSTGSVAIEDSVFDRSNPVRLALNGTATASVKRNALRSNTRNPIGQQPYEPDTYQIVRFTGNSTGSKVFAGNSVAAGPVGFAGVNQWMIGGDTEADANVLIGPRTSFYISGPNVTVRRNYVHHVYYGGWSQGELLELSGASGILVEHNVLRGSSWPVRGLAGEFRYNLVMNGGHEAVWPETNAYIHHNVFVGGDNDVGGITEFYNYTGIRIENNTFDGMNGNLMSAWINWKGGATTLRSNAFIRVPNSAASTVVITGGTVNANYNAFNQPAGTKRYSNGQSGSNDISASETSFAGPLPTGQTFGIDEAAVWKRQAGSAVRDVLAGYRSRYVPASGSVLIDAGDPAGGAGNDIGAVGAGTPNGQDGFGVLAP